MGTISWAQYHGTFILPLNTLILPPSTFILPLSTFILPPSTFILPPSTFILRHSTFILPPSTFILFFMSSLISGRAIFHSIGKIAGAEKNQTEIEKTL